MADIETCIFCHASSTMIGLLDNAEDHEAYCPFCGATQLEAREEIAKKEE